MKWVYAEDWPGETPPAWGIGGGPRRSRATRATTIAAEGAVD